MEKKIILFIDDDPDYIASTRLYLEPDYHVHTAIRADEAMDKIKETKPDLIILDAMMEPMSGFSLAKELKKDSQYKEIPIIMLTAVVPKIPETKYSPDDILRFEGEDFIDKGADIKEVLDAVKRLI